MFSKAVLLDLGLPSLVRGTQYNLFKEYSGPTFFDDWGFYGDCKSRSVGCLSSLSHALAANVTVDNLTHGNAKYVRVHEAEGCMLMRVTCSSVFYLHITVS